MSPKKIERLIRTLREQGVEYLKTPELEIRLVAGHVVPLVVSAPAHPVRSASVPVAVQVKASAPTPDSAIPPVQNEIPHHENQVAKLLKLSDSDLVDQLFPDYTAGTG